MRGTRTKPVDFMNIHIEKRRQEVPQQTMRRLEESNIAPSGVGDSANNGVSFRLRQRPTALDLLNRGLSTWYPGASEQLVWKDEEEQDQFEKKLFVLLKNSHVFQQFKDRVSASESFGNPMSARLVLEEFLEQELLFVGKRGVIHRHSELIKHLALTQRVLGGTGSAASTTGKMPLRNPCVDKTLRKSAQPSIADKEKSESVTEDESSDSSFSEEFGNSPSWPPMVGTKPVTFSRMKNLSDSLHVPML